MGGSQGISRARKRVKRRVRLDQIEDDNNTDDEQDLNYWMERRLRREAAADLVQKNVQQQEQHHKETEGTSEKQLAENEIKDHSHSACIGGVVVNQEKKKASTEGRSRRPESIIVEGAKSGINKNNNVQNNKITSSKDDESVPQAKAPAVTKTAKEIEASRIERMRIKNQQRKAARKAKKADKS